MIVRTLVVTCMAAFLPLLAATYNDLSGATDPSDATNGGYWNITGRNLVTISSASSSTTAPVNGVFRSVGRSPSIPLRSDKFRSLIISFY